MQIPLQETFPTPDGKIALQAGEGSAPITVRDALIVAATSELPEDANASPTLIPDKLKRFSIWQKLRAEEKAFVHFTAEEAAHLKARIGRIFGVVIAGPLFHLLDGKTMDGKEVPPKDVPQSGNVVKIEDSAK